jgi:hypothetical protein
MSDVVMVSHEPWCSAVADRTKRCICGAEMNYEERARAADRYERDYILPCFPWAKEAGIDLEALVGKNTGRTCVDLLVATLRRERDEAREWVRKLTVANTLTCVYCGHEYPPGSPAHGADVLTGHIAVCPKHPMAALRHELLQAQRDTESLEGALEVCMQREDATLTLLDPEEKRVDEVMALRAQYASLSPLRERAERLKAVLMMDAAYSLRDVLLQLSVAAEHLLGDHACDQHGHEGVRDAQAAAAIGIARIDAALAKGDGR